MTQINHLMMGFTCIILSFAPAAQAQPQPPEQSPKQTAATPTAPATWSDQLQQGLAARSAGNLQDSIDLLTAARASASKPDQRLRASAELGASLLQAQRLNEAATALKEAYAGLQGTDKARVALDLGNMARANRDPLAAQRFYREAAELGAGQPAIALSAALNLAHLALLKEKAAALFPLLAPLRQLDDPSTRARYLLNFGQQAATLPGDGLRLAFEALSAARSDADALAAPRLMVEARDALAQLYEDQKRTDDALQINRAGLAKAAAAPLGLVQDILIRLEWRQGRLLRELGRTDEAVAALQRATAQIEAVRQDLPIELDDGRSSFSSLLRPIYVDLADLLLRRSGNQGALTAIDTLELSRQAEMQDYLGERCVVATSGDAKQTLPAGTAVLYPLVLRDRLELLVKSDSGATRHEVKISETLLRNLTSELTEGLRSYSTDDYLVPARQLYDLLIRPIEAELAKAKVDTLVIASEGFLRVIPLGALHDGKRFLIEKYAIGTVTGMSMTDTRAADHSAQSTLLAGLSDPGPVVDVLAAKQISGVGELNAPLAATVSKRALAQRSLNLRSMRAIPTRDLSSLAPGLREAARREAHRDALKLPGVERELAALATTLPGSTRLLNSDFTVGRFRQEAASGGYRIVHIASHGVFGGDANSSFILGYDDVISMNSLQTLLNSESIKAAPIELLTLSACETAEGNERAPLGFSGAAIKARARSALGTLWPVADEAARQVMERFYANIARKDSSKNGKAVALQQAQIQLLQQPEMAHPFFWAPFTLVGNWN